MRLHSIAYAVLGSALLCASLSAQVYRDGYGRPVDPYRDRGNYGGYNRPDRAVGDPVNHTLDDIRRARSHGWTSRHDSKEFDKAENELFKFHERLARGRFENHHLDEAISHIQRLVNSARIEPRERDYLARDLYSLRDFRASAAGRYYGRPY